MKVRTIAIRPIWKLESRLFWLGLMSVPRPEVALAVLFQEQVRLAERGHSRRLGDVLHPERGVVLALTGDQRFAERVARLASLAVGPAVGDRWPIRVAVKDRNGVVLVTREHAAVHRPVERAELARVRAGEEVARETPVALAARVVVHRVARQCVRRVAAGDRRGDDALRTAEWGRQLEVAGEIRHPVVPVVADGLGRDDLLSGVLHEVEGGPEAVEAGQ